MQSSDFFEQLLEIGRYDRYEEIARVPGAGVHGDVVCNAGSGRLVTFYKDLPTNDRHALIKAVAMYEDTVGGVGSVTALQRLFLLVNDPRGDLLDWVLQNSRAFRYYYHDARSLEEYKDICERIAARKAETLHREKGRELEAHERQATVATANLYNAVRRGDIKAVRALLAQGANPSATVAPDGRTLLALARGNNREDIAEALQKPNA
jgi:hypothetical protein